MTHRFALRRIAPLSAAALFSLLLTYRAEPARSAPGYMDSSRPTSERVEDLLGQMTLAEKVGQMDQVLVDQVTTRASSRACPGCFGDPDPYAMQSTLIDNNVGSLLAGGTDMPADTTHSGGPGNSGRDWAVAYNAIQAFAVQQSRLHIPVLFGIDAVHGFSHPLDAPLFPHGMGMGATWDPAAAEQEGSVTGAGLRATGWVEDFAPVQDVYRDSRWGRAYEPWSEEAVLAGALGAAEVRGLQSVASPDSDGNPLRVAATIKHLAGNSASLNGHDRVEGQLSLRYLQDVFLPAYKDAIDADAKMVMISSSSINGVPATASHFLQTTLLRERLGFHGVTISDYQDVQALATTYHAAPDSAGAAALAVNAGLDMAMWVDKPEEWQSDMLANVREGKVAEARIDEAVRRILTLKFDLGLFDQPCVADPGQPCVDPDLAATTVQDGRDAALRSARESITLLKNSNGLLPLSNGTKLVVTGPNADNMRGQLGGWSISWQGLFGSGHPCCEAPRDMLPPGTTVLQGFQASDPSVVFASSQADAVSAASNADAIIAVVGEEAYAEGMGDNPAPVVPADQAALISSLAATGKPVIVVVMAGRPLALSAATRQDAAAILMAYQGSTEAGQAVADVVYGSVNPSGKLPVTWPLDADQPKFFDQLPSTAGGTGSGYDPQFSFGFGLSYTSFSVEGLDVSPPLERNGSVKTTFTVTNTGARSGTDIVPIFVQQSTTAIVLPPHRLVGFARVEDLAPGESRSVSVEFPTSRLAVTPGDIDSTAPPEVLPGQHVVEIPTATTPSDLFPSASPPLRAGFSLP